MGENLLKQLKWNNIKIFHNGIYKIKKQVYSFAPYRKRRQLNNIMMNLNQSLN